MTQSEPRLPLRAIIDELHRLGDPRLLDVSRNVSQGAPPVIVDLYAANWDEARDKAVVWYRSIE